MISRKHILRAVVRGRTFGVRTRSLSSRASSVLSALDIVPERELLGVYDGQWCGTGEVLKSVCPTTGEVLAHVHTVSVVIDGHATSDREETASCNYLSMHAESEALG